MNYWLLTTEYPPFYGGGISTYCYHTASMLSENGHHVTVFVNDKTVKSITIEQLNEARVIRFNPTLTNTGSFLGHITQLSYEFASVVQMFIEKEGRPDIIESQDYQGIAYFICQFKYCLYDWCKDIPIVITMHSPSFLYMEYNELPLYKKPNFWIGEMERFCIQAANLLISPSKYLVEELNKRFKITNTNLHVVANPYKFTLNEAHVSNPTSILNNDITFYGKLSPQKGTFKILEQFKNVWENGTDLTFTMVGDQNIVFPPLGKTMGTIVKKQYSKFIKQGFLKLKNAIPPSQLGNFFSKSTLFIVPSIVDNLPYVVLELMAQGKILIVSKQGGQSEVILNTEDGFIFDYRVPDSFISTLNKVIHLTKEERLSISNKAVETISKNYSYSKIYSEKIKLLTNLLNKDHAQTDEFPFVWNFPTESRNYISDDPADPGKLSVIIPYHNLGKYIDEAILSVLASSYKNIEVLVINDGSTGSLNLEKLNKYRNHPLVNVIDKPNTGLADTRNFGAKRARSEFIAFLDADDIVEKTYYEKAINILIHYKNVHFIGAWTQYFGNSKQIWPTFNPEPPVILTHNTINSSALIYKRSSFLNFGKNDPYFKIGLEDYDSVLSMLSNSMNGVAIPETLFNYRVRNKSMIKGVTNDVRQNYHKKIVSKYPYFIDNYKETVKQLIEANSPPLQTDNSTLDILPFHSVPILNKISKQFILAAKSNLLLKKCFLTIKRLFHKC